MTRYVRKGAQMRAVTLAVAARDIHQAADHVYAALRAVNGKVLVTLLDDLLKEERRLRSLAMRFEHDFIAAARVETGVRLPPLLSDSAAAEAAVEWCRVKGIA